MYRFCFVLQVIYGYSQQEIADSLGISKKTVSSNVLRGRKQLLLALNTIRQQQQEKNS
jgi:DNA-directed RNA polymerase specialized sigma24 family protein